jgi:hypothetical protein
MSLNPQARHGAESLSHQAKKGVLPVERSAKREKSPSRLRRATELKRGAGPKRSALRSRSKSISPATAEQKAKVDGRACIAADLGPCLGDVDPAHLIDRSLAPSMGDDVRAVVPLCRRHHNEYDEHKLDLSTVLEPRLREEAAWAVEALGLFGALRRITGKHWQPVGADLPQPQGDPS